MFIMNDLVMYHNPLQVFINTTVNAYMTFMDSDSSKLISIK